MLSQIKLAKTTGTRAGRIRKIAEFAARNQNLPQT
ncbi:hypothetical protein [Yoonia sp. 2307UL14-13]